LALRWLGDDVKLRAFGRVFIAVLLFAATPAAFAASPLCVDAVDMEYGNTSTTRPKYALSVCESVRKLARAYGVRESLAVAVASYESDFKPWAISHAGAVGPMQVKPAYHCPPFLGIRICKSRAEFTQSGVAHLAELLDDYSEPVALASYNAGRRGASRGLGVRYSETVRRIEGRL
jgi:soluble lytic murein transglycosylase-like protein